MRILHINCNYIGTTLHQLMIEELDKKGIHNEVFVPTYDKNISVIKANENVYVSECFNKCDRIIFDYKQKKILASIEKKYDVGSFDLIHAYTLFTDGNVARILSEKYHIPYVVAIRNTDVNDFFRKMVHLRKRGIKTMMKAEKVFFLSKAYKDTVFRKYISFRNKSQIENKSKIIPNGIDNFWFENIYYSKVLNDTKKISVVYVGAIDANKNILTTQKALTILRERGYETSFTVVGKNKNSQIYNAVCLDTSTIVLPPASKEQLVKIYRNADIFIMPSYTESFGLVYAEAMSQGLPVLYTRNQGFDGQFEDGEVGFAVDPNNPEEIANMVEKTIENYSAISKTCINKVKKFMWADIINDYIEIYAMCRKGL